jgi:hypothetical protein
MDSPKESDKASMRPKQVLRWKQVKVKNIRGSEISSDWANLIDLYYCGTLLSCILEMESKQPIPMAHAMSMFNDQWLSEFQRRTRKEEWYLKNFVEWISTLGYHIEITGDEFEAAAMPSQFA